MSADEEDRDPEARSPLSPEQLKRLAATAEAYGPAIERIQEQMRESVAPLLEAHTRAMEHVAGPLLEMRRAALENLEPLQRAHAGIVEWVQDNRETFLEPMLEMAEAPRESWERSTRPNLRELESHAFFEALRVTSEEGVCVIWAPRAEIVEELVAAETFSERTGILIARREEVLEDLAALIEESTSVVHSEQEGARELASKAVAAARDGHDEAAQALAAAALTSVLESVLHYPRLRAARDSMKDRDLEETALIRARSVAIELATSRCLVHTSEHVEGFNRHGSLHGLASHYGEGEALSALLLLGAWIRELSWIAEEAPHVLQPSASSP